MVSTPLMGWSDTETTVTPFEGKGGPYPIYLRQDDALAELGTATER